VVRRELKEAISKHVEEVKAINNLDLEGTVWSE
jgi:hypothetical protein